MTRILSIPTCSIRSGVLLAIFLGASCVMAASGASSITVPSDPGMDHTQGAEVGWGNFGAAAQTGFTGFTAAPRHSSLLVGFVMAAPQRPYRREVIFFRLPSPADSGVTDLVKAELRLVSNGVRDPKGAAAARELRVYHQALRVSSVGMNEMDGVNAGVRVAVLPVDSLPRIDRPLSIDVTEVIRAQLKAGAGRVAAFRFELSDDLDLPAGEDAFMQFRGFHSPVATDRPVLELSFR